MISKTKQRLFFMVVGQCVLILMLLSFLNGIVHAQNPVTGIEDFNGIGTSATSTLPANWKADKQSTARTLGTYAAAAPATERRAGDNMSSSAANGIYNYGAGDPASATDRAIGWISSGTGTASGNLYAWFQNNTGGNLASVELSYDVEKYRNGSNASGFRIQMYYSTDGVTWTSAGPDFLTSFAADADSNGFASAPGATVSVSAKTLAFSPPIPANGDFYLAWNYSVTAGSTTSSAQGLGIDNFSIGNPLAVTLADFRAEQVDNFVLVTWETVSELDNAGFNLYRSDNATGPQTLLAYLPSQAPGSVQGFAYSYEDLDVQPGQTWWYWLEDVSLSGVTTLHCPVSATVNTPTAVTLSGMSAGEATGNAALPSAATLLALMLLAGALVVRRSQQQNRGH